MLGVGILGGLLWYVMSSSISTLMVENSVSEARELPLDIAESTVTPLYSLTLVILAIAIKATLIAVFSTMAKNPKSLKNTAIGLVAFLIIVGLGFVLADGVETPMKDGEVLSANEKVYRTPAPDFEVSRINVSATDNYEHLSTSLEIMIVKSGFLKVESEQTSIEAKKGEVIAVVANTRYNLMAQSDAEIYKASCPF